MARAKARAKTGRKAKERKDGRKAKERATGKEAKDTKEAKDGKAKGTGKEAKEKDNGRKAKATSTVAKESPRAKVDGDNCQKGKAKEKERAKKAKERVRTGPLRTTSPKGEATPTHATSEARLATGQENAGRRTMHSTVHLWTWALSGMTALRPTGSMQRMDKNKGPRKQKEEMTTL